MGGVGTCQSLLVLFMDLKKTIQQKELLRRQPWHQSHDIRGVTGQELSFQVQQEAECLHVVLTGPQTFADKVSAV